MGVPSEANVRRRVAAAASPTRGASPAKPGAATASVVMAPKYGAKVSKVRGETGERETERRGQP